ncbi:MAG: phosphoribosylaminoimidazolesuccinocarboxamide synthase [Spirochaetales bacterium]|nr:phosphoribosylaminoimidazolesuccinocarboxamide synthase [Spirochaetales bacterium]
MDANSLKNTFGGFQQDDVSKDIIFNSGKVRDIFDAGDQLVISTSDRISAFDRILSTIPHKGEVLNRLSLFWFDKTNDIIPNHIAKKISARTIAVKKCEVLPVEVIVRGYLTGSAWRDYQDGKAVSGIELPAGMKMNQKFDVPLLTPSTKAEFGEHDMPISCEEIVKQGLVEESLWRKVEKAALELFTFGSKLLENNGLILVDTKYEFGILDGELVIVDEMHTPDSSRFWYADTYEELFKAGEKQRKIDKEYLRQWLMEEKNFMGKGDIPEIPDEVRLEVANRYIKAYEQITGTDFVPESLSSKEEILAVSEYLSTVK